MKVEIKLLHTVGKIKPNSYVRLYNNIIRVFEVDENFVTGFNIITNERVSFTIDEAEFLKLYVVDKKGDILGEVAYSDYDKLHPGDIVDTKDMNYRVVPANVRVGDEVIISCVPLSDLHKFRFVYNKDNGYSLPTGEKLLTGIIKVARGNEYIIETCDSKVLTLKRYGFVIASGDNTKRIYSLK